MLKNLFMKLRLRFKLLLLNALIYGTTLLIASAFWLTGVHESNHNSFQHRIGIQATVVAGNLNAALVFEDTETIEEVLNSLSVDSAVLSAMVLDRNRKVVAMQNYNHEDFAEKKSFLPFLSNEPYTNQTTIFVEDKPEGLLIIEASGVEVIKATENAVIAVLLVLMGSLMLTTLLSERGLRWMLGPVEKLSKLASEVKNSKNYSLRATVKHADEVGELAEEFNAMLTMIEQRDQFLESEVTMRTAELVHQATHDMLTQLPNRRGLQNHLKQLLLDEESSDQQHALLALDLDQFKVVNDTCGHIGGDELLKKLAKILKTEVRENDYIARLGGDEFAVILKNVDEKSMASKSEQIRQHIEESVFRWEGLSFNIQVSIGALLFSSADTDVMTLLKRVDAACFVAKDLGRNRTYAISEEDQGMSQRHEEMVLVREINSALVNDRFSLCRQPIKALNKDSNEQAAYEILLRLNRGGVEEPVKPDEFLPAAIRFGLSTNIDQWVVRTVVGHLQRAYASNIKQPIYWVNLSTTSLKDANFIDFLSNILKSAELPRHSLIFEITETGFIDSLKLVAGHMQVIRELGFQFALDDFGSGASSFKGLKELPLDYLKIDGSFICNLVKNDTDLIVARSIIEIASAMGLKIVAEHVENEETLSLVKELGADYAQGWVLGHPEWLPKAHPINMNI